MSEWQTRWTQNPLAAMSCGFKSRCRQIQSGCFCHSCIQRNDCGYTSTWHYASSLSVNRYPDFRLCADMAELADAPDLGSGGRPCRFKSCYLHFSKKYVLLHSVIYQNRGVEPPPYSGGAPLLFLYHIVYTDTNKNRDGVKSRKVNR